MFISKVRLFVFIWSSLECVFELFLIGKRELSLSLLNCSSTKTFEKAALFSYSLFISMEVLALQHGGFCVLRGSSLPPSLSFPVSLPLPFVFSLALVHKHRMAHCQRTERRTWLVRKSHTMKRVRVSKIRLEQDLPAALLTAFLIHALVLLHTYSVQSTVLDTGAPWKRHESSLQPVLTRVGECGTHTTTT